jgi:hypothetical protein
MALSSRKEKAVMVHANWMFGKTPKKAAVTKYGLWIASHTGMGCNSPSSWLAN